MPAFITFGRILFAVLFIYSGATKLFGIQATTSAIAAKVVIPALLTPYTSQLEAMTGMPTPQMLAIAVGAFEVIGGLMIALNFGARFFAILLIFFVAAATFYFHDFWNQPAPENAKTLIDALKNLSIIGALFMIAGYGRRVADGGARLWRCLEPVAPPWRDADAVGGIEDLRRRRLSGRARPECPAANARARRGSTARRPASAPAAPATARTCRSGP